MRKGLLAGWAFVLLGVFLLAQRVYVWDAGLCLVAGLVMLGTALFRSFNPPAPTPEVDFRPRLIQWIHMHKPDAWRLFAVSLALYAGSSAIRRAPESDFTIVLSVWLTAVLLFAFTLRPRGATSVFRDRLSRKELHLLAFFLSLVLLVRIAALERVPANFGGDEGTQSLLSLRLVEGPLGNPFSTSWYSVPTLSFLLYGGAMRLFGASVGGARALSALVGTLGVLATFVFGREIGGRRVGWISAVALGFSAYHIHFSRLASNQIFDPLIGTVSFWLLWRAAYDDRSGRVPIEWGWLGLAAGVGWYTYFGARWVTVMLAVYLAFRLAVEPRFWSRHRHGLLQMALGWSTVTLPLWFWYVAHPADLTARSNAVSIFVSGWLEREIQITGSTALSLLVGQFWKSITAFHFTPDPTFWYHPEAPLLDFVSGAFFLVGMVAASFRVRWPSRALLLLWFWSTLTMAWVLTENPPSSQRGLLLMPAVALFIAWGVESLLGGHPHSAVSGSSSKKRWVGSILALVALMNVCFYFCVYSPRRVYGNPTAWIGTEVAHYCNAHPPAGLTYFYGAPFMYWDFGTLAFMLRDQPGADVQPGEQPEVHAPARFILVPERAHELMELQIRYPGGKTQELRTDDERLLAVIYDW